MKVLFIIANIGDYHAARLAKLSSDLKLDGHNLFILELRDKSTFYSHTQRRARTLLSGLNIQKLHSSSNRQSIMGIFRTINLVRPDVVLQLGYSDGASIFTGILAKMLGLPIIFYADSKADDQNRSRWREAVKKATLRLFDGAVVAGERHKDYFESLGLSAQRIGTGYDVIDNDYFSGRAQRYRKKASLIYSVGIVPRKFVLVVSRLVARKRVGDAIRIYSESALSKAGVYLLIVGDGPERGLLDALVADIGIVDQVIFAPSVKNSSMPLYFSFASAIMLVSEYDQWGLSINEAMACGVPALVTARCGCANEIVLDGINGYVWDGRDLAVASALLRGMVLDNSLNKILSTGALEEISHWSLARFSDQTRSMIAKVAK